MVVLGMGIISTGDSWWDLNVSPLWVLLAFTQRKVSCRCPVLRFLQYLLWLSVCLRVVSDGYSVVVGLDSVVGGCLW
jgi:hypothetical protein